MVLQLPAHSAHKPNGSLPLPVTDRLPPAPLGPLLRIAAIVAIGDYLTKDAASRFVAEEATVFAEWLRLHVVHNDAGAFGLSMGAYTWQLNLALTIAAIVFVIPVNRELARVDRMAPRALGLILGGAIGNFVSLVLSPHGVVDFIAIHFSDALGLVVNVADLAAYIGLGLILRTGFLIVAEMRHAASVRSVRRRPVAPLLSFASAEREVLRPVVRDGISDDLGLPISGPVVDRGPRLPLDDRRPTFRETRVLEFPRPKADRPDQDAR